MDQTQEDDRKTSLYYLINNLDLQIQFSLFSMEIFNEADLDHIQSGITQQEQRLILLNVLQSRKYEKIDLISILENCNQKNLHDKLQVGLSTLKKNQQLHKEIADELKYPYLERDELKISKLWEVPHRNPYFTGRHSLLEKVSANFASNEQPQLKPGSGQKPSKSHVTVISACHGMGGVGKTQLAIEYVHRYKDCFPYVFWMPAESSGQIEIGYQKLAHDLQMNTEQPIDTIVREIKAWFHRHPGCLLVYDNASDRNTIKDYLPLTGCNIIVTSRNTEWHWLSNSMSITVEVFTVDEAREFFRKLLDDGLDVEEVDALSKLLGYLPLALAQAGAYIKNSRITIPDYLDLYKQQKEKLLANKSLPKFHHEPVFVSFNITMEVIVAKSSLAAEMLRLCAYFHCDDIPDFILGAFVINPERNKKSEIFEELRGILDSYSMIKFNPEKTTVSIHSILQEVIRLQLKNQNRHILMAEAFLLLITSFPDGDSLEAYKKQIGFIPHMETALHYIDDRLSDRAMQESAVIPRFLESLGLAYNRIGNYRELRKVLERTLNIKEKHYGSNHSSLATTLRHLGIAYAKLGEYAAARDHIERALKIEESHYGSNHLEVARTLINLGNVHTKLGDNTNRRDFIERALKIFELHHDPNHPEVAIALHNLGTAYGSLGDYTKERFYLERALKIDESYYGPNHPDIAKTLAALGDVYGHLGDYTTQRDYLKRALEIKESHYGSDHPELALTLANLGIAYGNLGDYTKEKEYLERALKINESHYGSDHLEFALTLTNVGNGYARTRNYDKQRDCLERALKIQQSHYGFDHPHVAITLSNLGNAYGRLGDYTKQRDYSERALTILQSHYGSNHPQVAIELASLGSAYGNLGDNANQLNYLERALKINESHYGPNHQQVAIVLHHLSDAYRSLGDYALQRSYLERALQMFEKHYGPSTLSLYQR